MSVHFNWINVFELEESPEKFTGQRAKGFCDKIVPNRYCKGGTAVIAKCLTPCDWIQTWRGIFQMPCRGRQERQQVPVSGQPKSVENRRYWIGYCRWGKIMIRAIHFSLSYLWTIQHRNMSSWVWDAATRLLLLRTLPMPIQTEVGLATLEKWIRLLPSILFKRPPNGTILFVTTGTTKKENQKGGNDVISILLKTYATFTTTTFCVLSSGGKRNISISFGSFTKKNNFIILGPTKQHDVCMPTYKLWVTGFFFSLLILIAHITHVLLFKKKHINAHIRGRYMWSSRDE